MEQNYIIKTQIQIFLEPSNGEKNKKLKKDRDFYPTLYLPQAETTPYDKRYYVPYICLWTGWASKLLTTSSHGLSTNKTELFDRWAIHKTGSLNCKISKFLQGLGLFLL